MRLENPSTILRILNNLKWADKFICLDCANTKSIKGDDIYDKKCGSCKRNVSLTKYTAFEGLRFPIEKAYGILETLIERAQLDGNAKVIKQYKRSQSGRQGYDLVDDPEEYRNSENISDDYEYLSLMDLINRSNEKSVRRKRKFNTVEEMEFIENQHGTPEITGIKIDKAKENRLDKLIEEIRNRWRPTVSSLAKTFEMEENTVKKFLEKINNRIRMEHVSEPANPLHHIIEYINDYNFYNRTQITVKYFLGLAMVPMPGEWKLGATKIKGKVYGINTVDDGDGEWSVYRMTITRNKDTYTFKFHERIEYGTQEWYDLFHVNIDK